MPGVHGPPPPIRRCAKLPEATLRGLGRLSRGPFAAPAGGDAKGRRLVGGSMAVLPIIVGGAIVSPRRCLLGVWGDDGAPPRPMAMKSVDEQCSGFSGCPGWAVELGSQGGDESRKLLLSNIPPPASAIAPRLLRSTSTPGGTGGIVAPAAVASGPPPASTSWKLNLHSLAEREDGVPEDDRPPPGLRGPPVRAPITPPQTPAFLDPIRVLDGFISSHSCASGQWGASKADAIASTSYLMHRSQN